MNLKKECIQMEKSFNNLLEANIIRKNTNMNMMEKYPKLFDIHKTSDDFYDDYYRVRDFLEYTPNEILKKEVYDTICYIDSLYNKHEVSTARDKYFRNYYNQNPLEAIKIIIDFISDDNINHISSYLSSKGIVVAEYENAVRVVSKVDSYIYKQYEDKIKWLEETKYERACKNLKEIALGIETGYLSDGTIFDALEFYRLVPFKYSKGIRTDFASFHEKNPSVSAYIGDDNFYKRIQSFTRGALPDKSDIILDYMRKNRFNSYTYVSFSQYRRLNGNGSLFLKRNARFATKEDIFSQAYGKKDLRKLYDEHIITEEIARKVLKELLDRGLPHLMEVYSLIEKKYVDEFNKKYELENESNEVKDNIPVKKTIKLTAYGRKAVGNK